MLLGLIVGFVGFVMWLTALVGSVGLCCFGVFWLFLGFALWAGVCVCLLFVWFDVRVILIGVYFV